MEQIINRERMITFLLETPMFEKLEPTEIMEVVHIVSVKHYEAGDIIFSEGDAGDAWYVIYRGTVDVLKHGPSGEKKITEIGEKACFGEISILDDSPRSATIQAANELVVLRIPRDAFNDLIAQKHLVAYKLLREMAILLAMRQRNTTARLSELLRSTELADVHEIIRDIVGESSMRE